MRLDTDIKFLHGVGPRKGELLGKELGVFTFLDLLYTFPYKYVDRSKFYKITEITSTSSHIQLRGKITAFETIGIKSKQRLVAYFFDGTATIELVWFKGISWIKKSVKPGVEYIVFGKPSVFNGKINIIHPDLSDAAEINELNSTGLQAHYSTTEKLKNNFITSKVINKLILTLLTDLKGKIKESLPSYILEKYNLLSLEESLINIHFPNEQGILDKAEFRLKFEELFYIQLNLLHIKKFRQKKLNGFVFSNIGEKFNSFYTNNLPFTLTEAQKRVIREIRKDLGSGRQMNRLLQGDVGSGKTLVGLMCMLIGLDNGYQACMMAPTEILANQHYSSVSKFLDGLGISVELLTGNTKKKKREEIHEKALSGELNILIGTHALLEDIVQFKNLGFVIIDEQHRFGVAQRAKLWSKNIHPPHILVMTATPIPRTLAMTLYGDLEVSVIDELPPGRKPIQTVHYFDSKRERMYGFLKKQIAEGRQVYIVYPLIKESENMDYKDLEDGYDTVTRYFPMPQYYVSIVHGKMKKDAKEFEMKRFIEGKTQIMIATTVIEVGVDIPNASVMVIESAERFGLSQLHQLRGRVGRGGDQSYCILMTSFKLTNESKKRIEIIVQSTDGFEISEADLRLRGPGDIEGTQQSGIAIDLKISNLARDGKIIQYVRDIADDILAEDINLQHEKNLILLTHILKMQKSNVNWGVIS